LAALALAYPLFAAAEDRLVLPGLTGTPGGTLAYAQRTERKTLNSAVAADDVLFSFQVCLDEKIHLPQRDLPILDGKPITVRKAEFCIVTMEELYWQGPAGGARK
jgi:hypothetical protein